MGSPAINVPKKTAGPKSGNAYLTGQNEQMTFNPFSQGGVANDPRLGFKVGDQRSMDTLNPSVSRFAPQDQQALANSLAPQWQGGAPGQGQISIDNLNDPGWIDKNLDLSRYGINRGTMAANIGTGDNQQMVRFDPTSRNLVADVQGFNEDAYLKDNPDVAKAVQGGQFGSGREHFFQYGQNEGRGKTPQEELAAAMSGQSDPGVNGIDPTGGGMQSGSWLDALMGNRKAVEDAIYGQATSRLDPMFAQREDRLRQSMANKGLPLGYQPGGEYTGANAEFDQFGRDKNDAYNQAIYSSIMGGGQEESRQIGNILGIQGQDFNQGLASAQLANQARQQNFGENMQTRQQQLAELYALGGGGYTQPASFVNSPGVDVSQYYQMLQNAQMGNAQNNAAGKGGMTSLLGSLGSAAIMASSREWKTDFAPAPEALPIVKALPVQTWSYKTADPSRHVGPMAEDWKAVTGLGDGRTIDVVSAFGVLLKAVQELTAKVEALEARGA